MTLHEKKLVEQQATILKGSRIQAASLPWKISKKGKLKILLITSLTTKRWILPKGNPENESKLWKTAGRESQEEIGLLGPVEHKPIGSYDYLKDLENGEFQRCRVYVFPQRMKNMQEQFPEMGMRKSKWVRPKKAAKMVQEPSLSELFLKFYKSFA